MLHPAPLIMSKHVTVALMVYYADCFCHFCCCDGTGKLFVTLPAAVLVRLAVCCLYFVSNVVTYTLKIKHLTFLLLPMDEVSAKPLVSTAELLSAQFMTVSKRLWSHLQTLTISLFPHSYC